METLTEPQPSPTPYIGRGSRALIAAYVIIEFPSIYYTEAIVVDTRFRTGITACCKRGVRDTNCPASCRPRSHTIHRRCWYIRHQWPQITWNVPPYILLKRIHNGKLERMSNLVHKMKSTARSTQIDTTYPFLFVHISNLRCLQIYVLFEKLRV